MTALCHPLNVNRVFSHCSVDAAVSCSTSQAGPYTSEQCRVPLGANCTGWLVCCCMQRLSVRPLSWESHLPPSQWCEPSLSLSTRVFHCVELSWCRGPGVGTGCVPPSLAASESGWPWKWSLRHPRSSPPIADRTVSTFVQSAGAGWHTAVIVRH